MNGILVIDKPAGPASHAVSQWVKRLIGAERIGHLGTLDPAASGVLPLAVNEATKRAAELAGDEKVYEFTLRLGQATDTDDEVGKTIAESPVPDDAAARLAAVLPRFLGRILQRPPVISAVKVNGVRAYKRVLDGEAVEMKPRQVDIDAIEILGGEAGGIRMRVACRAGTYVRSLARDLGEALGTRGHAASIRRLRSGPYTIDTAINVTELSENPSLWKERLIVAARNVEKALYSPAISMVGALPLWHSKRHARRK